MRRVVPDDGPPLGMMVVREASIPGSIPLYELAGWRERYGVIAGITGRGAEPGRGFDLGLWIGCAGR